MQVGASRRFLGFDLVFHAVTAAFDEDGFGVMEEPVQDAGGAGAVVVKDGRPLFEGFLGGQDDETLFVALADGLKEQIGPALVDGQIAISRVYLKPRMPQFILPPVTAARATEAPSNIQMRVSRPVDSHPKGQPRY